MSEQNISEIMQTTMENIRTMVSADTIIGQPVAAGNVVVIPVSKLSFGFASGGTDCKSKAGSSQSFVGGGGAGATVTPMGFIVVNGDRVDLLSMQDPPSNGAMAQLMDLLPDTVERLKELFGRSKANSAEPKNSAEPTAE